MGVALLASCVAHTPEAEEVLRGARMRMARKPSAVARELLRNFPKGAKRRRRRRRDGDSGIRSENGRPDAAREKLDDAGSPGGDGAEPEADESGESGIELEAVAAEPDEDDAQG